MSYTPTTWANGDTITAAGLNKMEQGIAAAGGSTFGVSVSIVGGVPTLSMTWQEIHDAMAAGNTGFIVWDNEEEGGLTSQGINLVTDSDGYVVFSAAADMSSMWVAASASGYPAYAY